MNPHIVFAGLFFLSVSIINPAVAADTPALAQIVCIQCHGAQSGRLGEPVKLWQGSIHAANGIACNDCHGGDPNDAANAMNPARGFLGAPKEKDIPAFCGRCHVGVEKDYMKSAHGRALGKGGPTCVTCHSNHLVVKASLDIINEKRCSQCHSYERARIIKAAMQQTEGRILAIGARIELYKGEGIDTDKMEKGLFSIRNSFHALFHNVDVEMVNRESARFNTDLNSIDDTLKRIAEKRGKRKLAGAVVVGAALLAALIFYLLRKSYD
jgi:hypothetical protein